MKSNLNKLIKRRDTVSNTITNYWNIVKSENVVKRGYRRNYNIKELLNEIKKLADERIELKKKILCGNLGIDHKLIGKDSMQVKIFELSELNEFYASLGMIETIPTGLKIRKTKKNLSQTEVMTESFIKALRKTTMLKITAIKKEMTDYNEKTIVEDNKLHLVA